MARKKGVYNRQFQHRLHKSTAYLPGEDNYRLKM